MEVGRLRLPQLMRMEAGISTLITEDMEVRMGTEVLKGNNSRKGDGLMKGCTMDKITVVRKPGAGRLWKLS